MISEHNCDTDLSYPKNFCTIQVIVLSVEMTEKKLDDSKAQKARNSLLYLLNCRLLYDEMDILYEDICFPLV